MCLFNTTLVRALLSSLVVGFLLLANGCKVPANGPTDPVVFIKEGRQWTLMDNKSEPPAEAGSAFNSGAASAPVDRSQPTRPPTETPLP